MSREFSPDEQRDPGELEMNYFFTFRRLAQIAELWLRLERPEADAQELFRAARWIEEAEHDLAALAREGNLGVLAWLSDKARAQVEASLAVDLPPLLAELEAEYLGDVGPPPS